MAEPEKTRRQDPRDLISRGEKKPSPAGTLTFVGLRGLDPFIQYQILKHGLGAGLLHKLGLQTLPQGLPAATGFALIDKIGLSPYRLILLSMATGSAVKQIYWQLVTSYESFPVSAAVPVSIYNTLWNSLNDILFTCALTSGSLSGSETFPQPPLIVGGILYAVGILAETISETQRLNFKKKPENAGQLYTKGLFSLSRHINYAGYTLWRTGYSMAAGGWVFGLISFSWNVFDFTTRSIPILSRYCQDKVSRASKSSIPDLC